MWYVAVGMASFVAGAVIGTIYVKKVIGIIVASAASTEQKIVAIRKIL